MDVQHGGYHGHNAEEHDDALDEVVHGGGLVTAQYHIHGGQHGHEHHAVFIGYAETHLKQGGDAFVHAGRIGYQKDKGDDAGCHTKTLAVVAGAEKVGHRAAFYVLGHLLGAAAQQYPGEQGADEGVADAYPGGRQTVFPAKLSGIAHKDDCRKITGAVGEGGEPGTYRTAAEHKTFHTVGLLARVDADAYCHGQENYRKEYLDKHAFSCF